MLSISNFKLALSFSVYLIADQYTHELILLELRLSQVFGGPHNVRGGYANAVNGGGKLGYISMHPSPLF